MSDLMLPEPPLRSYVEGYWQRRGPYDPPRKVRVLADACTKIIFELAPMPWGSCYVVGTQIQPIVVTLSGMVDRIGIRFRPGMAGFFLGETLDGLAGGFTMAAPLLVREGERIHGRLAAAPASADRAAILNDWLTALLPHVAKSLDEVDETRRLVEGFRRSLSPPALAATMGWTERRLQRVCRERFGATAASLHRLYRFQALQVRLSVGAAQLTDLAAELGFSDQAHMAREFRHFAGTTISSFRRERSPVGNVQDGGLWLPVLRNSKEMGE